MNNIPNIKNIDVQVTITWTYAKIDNRNFKVGEDHSGENDLMIMERIEGERIWVDRSEWQQVGDAILDKASTITL